MTRAMDAGIKISNASDLDDSTKEITFAIFGMLNIGGARESISRYKGSFRQLKQTKQMNYFYKCMYETSNLLEHLNSVRWYTEAISGSPDELGQTIKDMRNHLRHDLRENLPDPENKIRVSRAKHLRIDENFLVHIGIDANGIKMGDTELNFEDVENLLSRAGELFQRIIKTAEKEGRIQPNE